MAVVSGKENQTENHRKGERGKMEKGSSIFIFLPSVSEGKA
jgi:hypothetical protein